MQGVDELRVESRGHLDAHAAEEEPEVHHAQVGLFVPWHLVLRDQARKNGVRSTVLCPDDGHVGDEGNWLEEEDEEGEQ